MDENSKKKLTSRFSIFLLLCVVFLDFMGVGLVFPLFASLLFDPSASVVAAEMGGAMRGFWMGILIALTPLVQFFFSPILGSLSDQKGRKLVILFGLAIGTLAYVMGVVGIYFHSLFLLILYRSLFGVCSATMTVVQAALVDLSTPKTKARYFGLYNMALGTGFTLGPFLGGQLSNSALVSWFSYSTPFVLGAILTLLNFVMLLFRFSESRKELIQSKLDVFRGIRHAKAAFVHPTLRIPFLAFFCFVLGWDFFIEFIPVTLRSSFSFTTSQTGNFLGYCGLCYALSVGILTQPIVKRFSLNKLLNIALLAGGPYLFAFLLIENPIHFWGYLFFLNFLLAFFWPMASTYVSDHATESTQGEVLGIYHSIQALALILSPMLSGSLVGAIPSIPVVLGATLMMVGGLVFASHSYLQSRVSED